MMNVRNLVTLVIIGFTFSCASGHQHDEELLAKAHEKQLEIIKMIGELESTIESSELEAKDSLLTVIEEFEENIFEIPGYHLELPGHEGHDHGHSEIELTDQEIHDVQVEMLKELEEMRTFVTSRK